MTNRTMELAILIDSFISIMPSDMQHKSCVVKIKNRINRYSKRHRLYVGDCVRKVNSAIIDVEASMKDLPVTISLGALIWLIHNRQIEWAKPIGFDKIWFEQLNKLVNAQGVIMDSAKVVSKLEESMEW